MECDGPDDACAPEPDSAKRIHAPSQRHSIGRLAYAPYRPVVVGELDGILLVPVQAQAQAAAGLALGTKG